MRGDVAVVVGAHWESLIFVYERNGSSDANIDVDVDVATRSHFLYVHSHGAQCRLRFVELFTN